MKKIITTLLFIASIASFCNAQWTAGLQYSKEISADMLKNHFSPEVIYSNGLDCCFGDCGYNYNPELNFINNSTTSLSIAHKKNRWQLGLALNYQVRDFETYAFINSTDEIRNTAYITSRYNDIFRQPMPVPSNSLNENSRYLQQQRYIGVTPSLDFYWLNRPKFKSYMHTAITLSEKYSRANQTELLATTDNILTYAAGLGFEHALGQKMAIQYGINYQGSDVDFLTEIELVRGQKLHFFSPFLTVNYHLFQ